MKYFNHFCISISICFVFGSASTSAAETPAASKSEVQPELKVINLAVYPAPIPQPALKYRLLPRYADQTPGNAAPLYDAVFLQIAFENGIREALSKDIKDEKEQEKYYTNADKLSLWLDTPLAEIPKDEVRKLLDNIPPWWMEYAEIASRRMDCDWDLPVRGMNNPYNTNLYYLQSARSLVRILAMKARLSMAEGKPEDAIKSLQMVFSLSQQTGKGKVPLVCYGNGIFTASMARDQLLDLCQLKDTPNLYWSLSNLPHPYLNFHDTVEFEESLIERLLPELQEAKKGQHSPEQWQNIWEDAVERINDVIAGYPYPAGEKKEKYAAQDAKKLLKENYPKARDYLLNLGWAEKEMQSMAPAQVLLLYCAEINEEMQDDNVKWMGIDYLQWPNKWQYLQSTTNWQDMTKDLAKTYKDKEIIPLTKLIPPFYAAVNQQLRLEREMASLRLIEAIRLYAFSHDGKLPGSLDDIEEVPIPSNPQTGKPFSYRLDGDTAVLLADGNMRLNYEYRIKIAK